MKRARRRVKTLKVVIKGAGRSSQAERETSDVLHPTPDLSRQTYLSVPEAVQYLRFPSPGALYQWVLRRRIPKCRRGRTVLFLRRDLDEAVQSKDREAGAHLRVVHGRESRSSISAKGSHQW